MLLRFKIACFFLSGLLSLSCSSTKDLPTKSLFTFQYGHKNYEIISISDPAADEGFNILTLKENGESVFRSMDQDQDGVIDLVQYGNISIPEANLIYSYGIRQAMSQDKFKARNSERIYTFTENNIEFTIKTFGFYVDLLYNKFTIHDLTSGKEEVFLDIDADGKLDKIDKGTRKIENVQSLYEEVIKAGQNEKKIELMYEKFVVRINSNYPAS